MESGVAEENGAADRAVSNENAYNVAFTGMVGRSRERFFAPFSVDLNGHTGGRIDDEIGSAVSGHGSLRYSEVAMSNQAKNACCNGHFGAYQKVLQYALSNSNGSTDASKS